MNPPVPCAKSKPHHRPSLPSAPGVQGSPRSSWPQRLIQGRTRGQSQRTRHSGSLGHPFRWTREALLARLRPRSQIYPPGSIVRGEVSASNRSRQSSTRDSRRSAASCVKVLPSRIPDRTRGGTEISLPDFARSPQHDSRGKRKLGTGRLGFWTSRRLHTAPKRFSPTSDAEIASGGRYTATSGKQAGVRTTGPTLPRIRQGLRRVFRFPARCAVRPFRTNQSNNDYKCQRAEEATRHN